MKQTRGNRRLPGVATDVLQLRRYWPEWVLALALDVGLLTALFILQPWPTPTGAVEGPGFVEPGLNNLLPLFAVISALMVGPLAAFAIGGKTRRMLRRTTAAPDEYVETLEEEAERKRLLRELAAETKDGGAK